MVRSQTATLVLKKSRRDFLIGQTPNRCRDAAAALGEGVLPTIYDALFARNHFKRGYSRNNALRVLAQMKNRETVFIEVLLNQELGEPFRRDAMKKPNVVAGIDPADMRPQ